MLIFQFENSPGQRAKQALPFFPLKPMLNSSAAGASNRFLCQVQMQCVFGD